MDTGGIEHFKSNSETIVKSRIVRSAVTSRPLICSDVLEGSLQMCECGQGACYVGHATVEFCCRSLFCFFLLSFVFPSLNTND